MQNDIEAKDRDPGSEERGRHDENGGRDKAKYKLNIEGVGLVDWHEDTITTEQIAALGGWEPGQGVVEVDADNNERTLQPNEVIQLKPGLGFGKKHRWKRG